ncbi:hypothetical protein NHH03_00990 [Stieleria sp. TO1_6]|uniref:hypothetical protein n=1 Tax=Stieleria tagensis TaxID=2956795 RepID=UPI00209B1020|nr:hypothetical protein [Stieleria tagensis]MCO8120292.1 hypothetical protein [Stieleria tagensis]
MDVDGVKRLPLYSLSAGAIVASVLVVSAISGIRLPSTGLGALGFLPLAAALVDAVRLSGRRPRDRKRRDGAGQGGSDGPTNPLDDEQIELKDWLQEKANSLTTREQALNARALALQQWMQFPDAIGFRDALPGASIPPPDATLPAANDPMARHDRELFELIEQKTQELFDSLKQDAYRRQEGDRMAFNDQKIRDDLIALVADVAAIYRPGEESPLLNTNVEALSRAAGRGALRFLVAVENLPGGLASYDFRTIYNVVIRAVKTYGMYKSAKPYIDVASGVLFAGRIVISTNPITLVAWWAASKATTYGASKLGGHVIDQQAVGLIRQLVEIVAIEVASVYSPMVRYRDAHWIYGVELVHLASELSISDTARVEAMKQIAVLTLRDEYGRVSLMRHLASGSSPRPAGYAPANSLSAAQRMTVVERLESFMLAHVMTPSHHRMDKSAIDAWQFAAAQRLEIQFHAGHVDASREEQTERAIWSLAAFALEHFGDDPQQAIDRLQRSHIWNATDTHTQAQWINDLTEEPPFLYHSPMIEPSSPLCEQFLTDLVEMAAGGRKQVLANLPESEAHTALLAGESILLPPWTGEEALRVTAYFLRADAARTIDRYHTANAARVLEHCDQKTASPQVVQTLDYLVGDGAHPGTVRCVYRDAETAGAIKNAVLTKIDATLICFTVSQPTPDTALEIKAIARGLLAKTTIEKIAGYVRSDCKITFPDGTSVVLPGSSLRSYESYFAGLLN